MRGMSLTSVLGVVLIGGDDVGATVRVGGVLPGDFSWIFRGFTECAGVVIPAQQE